MKSKLTTQNMVKIAIVAALYAVLTIALAPISYGALQFRLSEIMVFLAYFSPIHIVGLTIGCFIANLSSPYFILDGIFGTSATLISCIAIYYTGRFFEKSKKGLIVASIWPTVFNGLIVGWIIYTCMIMEGTGVKSLIALVTSMGSVAVGEFGVVTVIGVPLMYFVVSKYKNVLSKIVG